MNSHSFIQYLKYRWFAMGRHGMHSPFVYGLVEDCIQEDDGHPLLMRVRYYLADWPLAVLQEPLPDTWSNWLNTAKSGFAEKQVVLIEGIHQSRAHTEAWKELCSQNAIDYSIDLYDFGLLFKCPEFKEKQHFVLKNK